MAYAIANTHSASILDRAVTFFANQREAYARLRLYTQTMNELQSLSTRELNDLGLSRSSLHDTAYTAVYG
ncbi:MAG: DUF1127 domain-containing protein [Rhodobacteraceae bacterium]|nr:DUF1127 domain-containing protein [Paracoccaceae bacterium]